MTHERLGFEKSKLFTEEIENLIPGGAHTYSKGRDQFPLNASSGIVRGDGAWVWDADGNRVLDWGMGLMSVSLGHGHSEILEAVCTELGKGVTFSRPAEIELKAAKEFLELTGDEMIKFARHGSSVTTGAVKLARGYTGRKLIALPAEHPFFSFDDWFIGTTPSDFGIPDALKDLAVKFNYNDIKSLEKLVAEHKDDIACVIMEPVKFDEPKEGFLEKVREICTENGIILIFDEMQSGLKFGMPGATSLFGVKADLTTWGKGIGGGYGISALTGKREIMELGGLKKEGSPKLFLLSSTHGGEAVGLAALIKTIEIFKRDDVVRKNWENGGKLRSSLDEIIASYSLENYLKLRGYPCFMTLDTLGKDEVADTSYRTLLMQEMIARGVLFQGLFFLTPSHGEEEIEKTLEAFDASCSVYAQAIEAGSTDNFLVGPAIKPVFRKVV